jgi:hypothetical protein
MITNGLNEHDNFLEHVVKILKIFLFFHFLEILFQMLKWLIKHKFIKKLSTSVKKQVKSRNKFIGC